MPKLRASPSLAVGIRRRQAAAELIVPPIYGARLTRQPCSVADERNEISRSSHYLFRWCAALLFLSAPATRDILEVLSIPMAEMSVIWLRVAAVLYSLGLLHAILTLIRKRESLFRVALGAFAIGAVFHFVSILEEGLIHNRCPVAHFYETLSMCAFLVAVLFLFIYWRYKLESLSVFIFPLVFMMTLVATLGNPVGGVEQSERCGAPG